MRLARSLCFVVLLVLVACGASGVAAQEATPEATPIFTDTVDIEGRSVGLTCSGEGSPTVVLIGGLTLAGDIAWPVVVDAISPLTRVCVFDRAGIGPSDPAPTAPQTAADVVADLHAALQAAGESGPYVPVGFSVGGMFARLYASTYPDDLAGLVLVDPTPAGITSQDIRLPASEAERERVRDYFAGRDPSLAAPIDFYVSDGQLFAVPLPPPVPTVVIAAGMIDPTVPEVPLEVAALWLELQAIQVRELNARLLIADQSGHLVPLDHPEVVVTAIQMVVEAVRQPGTWATPVATPAP
jgi:pimeloyl-ACP methyl ester carboxylesterase